MSENKSGWELFNSCFKPNEEVVVIDTDDRFFWGRMTDHTVEGCELHANGKTRFIAWDDIRFMSHDGFPVRKILGACGSPSIEKLDTTDTRIAIRAALAEEFPTRRTARFGDPFDIENVSMELHHAGNSGSGFWRHYWGEARNLWHSRAHFLEFQTCEEVIVMEANDGARGELWDLTTVYAFEANA